MKYSIKLKTKEDIIALSKVLGSIDVKKLVEQISLLDGNELWIWIKDISPKTGNYIKSKDLSKRGKRKPGCFGNKDEHIFGLPSCYDSCEFASECKYEKLNNPQSSTQKASE